MNTDLIRFIDSISRDKSIDKESVFADLEAAMISAVRKANDEVEDVTVQIDRATGEIAATVEGKPVDMKSLGRIAAQTAKQVLIQRVREDERNSIFDEYSQRVGEVVTGTVTRYEGGGLTVNLGRTEAFMPRSEQIPGQTHHAGERVRGMILDVREEPNQVRIVLTQTHPDYIRRLFELEVPEVNERIIELRALAREAGYRTKIAVSSIDSKVDAVGACVGVRGSRIRNIVDELGGEKIDIVRWNESSQVLITNSLKPAEIKETFLCFELGRATVIVDEEQLSLAIGKRGQNVRLAARLTGWDIDIKTPAELDKNVDSMEKALKDIEGVEDVLLEKMLAIGVISLADLVEVGVEPLVTEFEVSEELAARIVERAKEAAAAFAAAEAEAARNAAVETAAAVKAKAEAAAAAATAKEETDEESGALPSSGEDPEAPADQAPADPTKADETAADATETDETAVDPPGADPEDGKATGDVPEAAASAELSGVEKQERETAIVADLAAEWRAEGGDSADDKAAPESGADAKE